MKYQKLKLCTPKGGRFLDLYASTELSPRYSLPCPVGSPHIYVWGVTGSQNNLDCQKQFKLNCYNIPVLSKRYSNTGRMLDIRTSQASRSVSNPKVKAVPTSRDIRNLDHPVTPSLAPLEAPTFMCGE
jgi:hypothetical protein